MYRKGYEIMDIAGFLKHYSGLSKLTKKAYGNTLLKLESRIGNSEPTDADVRKFLKKFKLGTTLQRHKAAVKRYLTYKKQPWVFDSKEFATVHKKLPKYLSREKVQMLIDNAGNEDEAMFIETLFITGIRIAELQSLTIDSLNDDGIQFTGKGDKERLVPITDKAFLLKLHSYAKKQKGLLFPLKYYDYWLLLRKLCLQTGIQLVSPHSLRHSRAIDLINKGVPLGGVQVFLGHEQPSTTMIYLQLTQGDLKRELEKVEG